MMLKSFIVAFSALLVAAGCGESYPVNAPQGTATTSVTPEQPQVAAPANTPSPTMTSAQASPAQPGTVNAPASNASAPPATTQQVAKTGDGVKGSTYGGGIITTPVKEYWKAQERITFEIQIPQAMKLFKAQNDRNPTEAEFWDVIIKENGLELPQLPQGERYVYDQQQGELMVERPAPPQ